MGKLKKTKQGNGNGNLRRGINEIRTPRRIETERYMAVCGKYIKIISASRNGKLDPDILSMAQLSEISREVQLRAPDSEFPLGLGSLYSEMLTRIAHVDLVWHRRRIIILIHIPLLERTEYNLYGMHPWLVPQEGNYTGSAHIVPTMPYVAVSTDRRVYF